MPNIRDIRIQNLGIREIRIPEKLTSEPPLAIPIYPPVTSEIGTPVVNIPGCVQAHRDSNENANLKEEDPDAVMTLCDAGTPSFRPIDYDASRLDLEQEPPKPPAYKPPPEPPAPEQPAPAAVPKTPKAEVVEPCPTRAQELKNPIGKILEGNKKITGYELVGKECIEVVEQLKVTDQIISNIPNAGAVTATASIAVVATTSALLAKPLADLLLKVVKPVTKKVLKKVAALRGKKIPVQSANERIAEQRQRNQAVKALRSVRPLKK